MALKNPKYIKNKGWKKNKEDFYSKEQSYKLLYEQLSKHALFQFKQDNEIIKTYIDAKAKGHYKRLIYEVNNVPSTCRENIIKLKYLSKFFKKPFSELTEKDIDMLQEAFNKNKLKTEEGKPIKRSTKLDLMKHLKQFWKFYRLYAKEERNKEISNITEYLKVKNNEDETHDFEYITLKELMTLTKHTSNDKQKTLLMVAFENGARGCEYLNLKRKHFKFDEETKKWNLMLPKMKGGSYSKRRIELDLSNEAIDNYFKKNSFQDEEDVFSYSYNYWRKYLKALGKKALNKNITPKIFRKSCAMYLHNQNVNEGYIKAHIGWSPDTRVLKNYVRQSALKKPETLRKNMMTEAFQDNETQMTMMKSQLNKLQNQINDVDELRKDKEDMIKQINEINIRDDEHKKMIKEFYKLLKATKK
jgi:integrase